MIGADPLSALAQASAIATAGDDRARLAAVLHEPREGAVLVIGAAGAGKSTLLATVDDHAGPVRRTRVGAWMAHVPLSGASAMAAAFDAPEFVALSMRLLEQSGREPTPGAVAVALLTLIREGGFDAGVLVIDDADLMDGESQVVLSLLATRLAGTGLRIVASCGSEHPPGPLRLMRALTLEADDPDRSRRIATEAVGGRADGAVHQLLVDGAHGNVRAVSEIAARLTESQLTDAAPIELPFRLASAETPPEDGLLARLSCAHLHTLRAVRAAHADELDRLLSSGAAAQDGRYTWLADPVLRSRTYWALPAATRTRLHGILAEAESGTDPALARWHVSHGEAGSASPTEMIEDAAEFARRGLAWQAVEVAERALALADLAPVAAPHLLRLAHHLLYAGEPAYAERYVRHAHRAPSHADRVGPIAAMRLITSFVATRRLSVDDGDYRCVSEQAHPLRLTQLAALHVERWEVDSAAELLERATAATPFGGRHDALLSVVSAQCSAVAGTPDGPTAQPAGSGRGPAPASPLGLLVLGRTLTFLDRNDDARRTFHAVLDVEPAANRLIVDHARTFLAELEIRAGRHVDAAALIDRGRSPGIARRAQPLDLVLRAWSRLIDGDTTELDGLRARFTYDDPSLAARLAAFEGASALATGRLDDAVAALRAAMSIGAAFGNPTLLRCEVDLVESCVLSDRRAEALEHARVFLGRHAGHRTPWTDQARARIEALIADGDESLAVWERALRMASSGDLMYERARTFAGHADRLDALGRAREAAEQWRSAHAVFSQLGTTQWTRRTARPRSAARRPSPVDPLLAALTPDELEVVRLVRRGLRNKEIAGELYVSVRTVEVRLTSIYRRLGVMSRSQLISMLAPASEILTERVG
ncbi:LuxR C-terminal-related transcriptional regulator [Agromyces sp. LHK192]|uniref:LuxR C-terminal-related transcriptional regulator n=1 Tax=Agromyces sp. LHK192 TaxID=2498704 RepID=UPI000FD6E83F|nr:LuxR C-terminal-related transcriptional regulator [Agromyces sp. LHK192]